MWYEGQLVAYFSHTFLEYIPARIERVSMREDNSLRVDLDIKTDCRLDRLEPANAANMNSTQWRRGQSVWYFSEYLQNYVPAAITNVGPAQVIPPLRRGLPEDGFVIAPRVDLDIRADCDLGKLFPDDAENEES